MIKVHNQRGATSWTPTPSKYPAKEWKSTHFWKTEWVWTIRYTFFNLSNLTPVDLLCKKLELFFAIKVFFCCFFFYRQMLVLLHITVISLIFISIFIFNEYLFTLIDWNIAETTEMYELSIIWENMLIRKLNFFEVIFADN